MYCIKSRFQITKELNKVGKSATLFNNQALGCSDIVVLSLPRCPCNVAVSATACKSEISGLNLSMGQRFYRYKLFKHIIFKLNYALCQDI